MTIKKISQVLFLFIFNSIYAQEVSNDSIINFDCESGLKEAKQDIEKGIYNSYSYGLLITLHPRKVEEGFDEFYKNYMREKYSINIQHRGCVVTDRSSCYSQTMNQFIDEKFGSDIFKRGRKEAFRLFKKKIK